jgi:hypothetical protein
MIPRAVPGACVFVLPACSDFFDPPLRNAQVAQVGSETMQVAQRTKKRKEGKTMFSSPQFEEWRCLPFEKSFGNAKQDGHIPKTHNLAKIKKVQSSTKTNNR